MTHRVFFALWPDDTLRDATLQLRSQYSAPGRDVSRTHLHLTLAFAGTVSATLLTELRQAAIVSTALTRIGLQHQVAGEPLRNLGLEILSAETQQADLTRELGRHRGAVVVLQDGMHRHGVSLGLLSMLVKIPSRDERRVSAVGRIIGQKTSGAYRESPEPYTGFPDVGNGGPLSNVLGVDATLHGHDEQLMTAARAELLHEARAVCLHGLDADTEHLGDLAHGHAIGQQLQHLALARRQIGHRVAAIAVGAPPDQLTDKIRGQPAA